MYIMKSFKIKELYGDGYERWSKVEGSVSKELICVHFIEYDEYLENSSDSKKRRKDDIINGKLKIELVTHYKFENSDKYGFVQPINKSSHIIAIGIVKEIEDSDSIMCSIQGLGDDIIIEFEDDVEIEIGAKIEIKGSLELELDSCDFEKANL